MCTREIAAAAISLAGLVIPGSVLAEGEWIWSVSPYIWYTDTDISLEADGSEIGAGTITADDLFNSLDIGGQIVVEAGREGSHWSGLIDVTYLKISDEERLDLQGLGQLELDTESEQLVFDAAVAFWPGMVRGNANIYAGLRHTDLDDDTQLSLNLDRIELASISLDRDFTDVLVGGRYRFDLNDRWSLHGGADYAFGDSEGIFQVQAFFQYRLDKTVDGLIFGYRYKEAEFEDGGLGEEFEYGGPFVAVNFLF